MNAHQPCPDSALLAAFIDGMLVGDERSAVVAHMAECGECRAVAMTVVAFKEVVALDEIWQAPVPRSAPLVTSTTRVRRWAGEKARAPAWVIAAAAVIAAVAIPIALSYPSWSSRRAVSTLVDASAGERPIDARLSGGFGYAPRPRGAAVERPPASRWRLVAAAGRIRDIYEDDPGVASRQAVGIAALLVGQVDDAVASLSLAAANAPHDAGLLNDLAAAYYQRATTAGRPDDLPRALSAVQRALTVAPAANDAWFNRALIISALGLRGEARTAWRTYLERDPTSPWADEARARLEKLGPASTVASDWAQLRARLERGADAAAADLVVGRHTSRARDYLEKDLLQEWVTASQSGQDQDAVLAKIRVLSDAFVRLAGDRLYVDALSVIDGVRARANRDETIKLVAAHHEYLDAITLMSAARFADAAPVLARAETHLAALDSPLAIRMQIELAATDYYGGRSLQAAASLPHIKAEADRNGYSILVTRAAWVQGIVAFGRNEYGDAQLAYEEMVEVSRTSGDVDQHVFGAALLANLHDMLGESSAAWGYRVQAAGMLEETFQPSVPAALFLGAAGDAAATGNYAAALVFESALLTVKSLNPAIELQARAQRSRTLHQLGKLPEARDQVQRVRELLTQVQDPHLHLRVEPDVLTAEAEVLINGDRERAIAAAERALTLPHVQLDQLRVARLNRLLAESTIAQGNIARAERAVQQGIDALETFQTHPTAESRLRASDSAWSLYVKGIQLALRRGDMARAFNYSERRRIRTTYERREWGREILTLDDIQRSLDSNTAVAVLNQLDDELLVWVIRRSAVTTFRSSVTAARGSGLVASHLHEITRAVASPAISGELFDLLLRPASSSLRGIRNIAMIADAPYHRVAFAALHDRKRSRFVVEDHAVVAAPSAAAFVRAQARAREHLTAGPRNAVVFESAGASTLLFSRPDGLSDQDDRMGALYRSVQLRRGDAATPRRLLTDVGERDVVHVAAPVIANDEFPVLSRLTLTDEPGRKHSGSLFARSIADTSVSRATLVALETSVSESSTPRAEGPLGFARALLAAGVSTVVGPVAEVKASDLGQTWLDFHRSYASGVAAADSLRRAQLSALRESNHRPGPWALITVFGSTQ